MTIRTLLIDDEPLAREKLQGFLGREDDIEVIAECRDGREAVEVIDREKPDLVFLDVQMPEMDGFDVLEHVDPDALPTVIFTTAFDQYALTAFDVHAVDYLLKPFDRERFQEALDRARKELGRARLDDSGLHGMREQLLALLRDVDARRPKYPERLVVKSSGRVVFVRVDSIDWIDAAGNYVKIHTEGETHTLRETMTHLEDRLDPERFLRIHRSTIVRIDRIKELQQQFHGDYVVILEGGQRLTLSRSYRDRIQDLLDRSL